MTARAVFFRLLGILAVIAVLFFASFFAAITIRNSEGDAGTASPLPGQSTSNTFTILVSEKAELVPTTGPPIGKTTSTSTSTTIVLINPDVPRLDIDVVFDAVHDRLATEVGVPIRLPSLLDADADEWIPTISSLDESGYVLHVGSGPDCNGATACRIATFTARRSATATPQLAHGTIVPLPNGLIGIFSDASCGTECNNGFITWIEGDVRYSVGSRVASGQAVLDLAWRSIDRSLPTPSGPDVCGPGAPQHDGMVARTITTDLGDDRRMHWVAVCSAAGTQVEIIATPGELRWVDVNVDGRYDAVVEHADGSSTLFSVSDGGPHASIDSTNGGRLLVGELGCGDTDGDGRREAFDLDSSEELQFVTPTTVRRIERIDLTGALIGDC